MIIVICKLQPHFLSDALLRSIRFYFVEANTTEAGASRAGLSSLPALLWDWSAQSIARFITRRNKPFTWF